jgi:hypothetical protein
MMKDWYYNNMANDLMHMDEPARANAIMAMSIEDYKGLNNYLDAERVFLLRDIKGAVIGRKLTFNL